MAPSGSTPPRRLVFDGATMSLPEVPGRSVTLRGVNLMFMHQKPGMDSVTRADRQLSEKLPGVNVVRVVADHWMDAPTINSPRDCHSDDVEHNHVQPGCLTMFDEIIDWSTKDLQAWTILTARMSIAAGDGGEGHTIDSNPTLRDQWVNMWGALAKRYAALDNILGYEVMSEPRSEAHLPALQEARRAACFAIWANDPRAACVIGPARYYNRYHLNRDLLITGGGPVLYLANFFEPKAWVKADFPAPGYPGTYDCCAVTEQELKRDVCGRFAKACPEAPTIRVDKHWLATELARVTDFRAAYKVPVMIDQFGAQRPNTPAKAAQAAAYMRDLMEALSEANLPWIYWIWRRTQVYCSGNSKDLMELLCEQADGTYKVSDEYKLSTLRATIEAGRAPEQPPPYPPSPPMSPLVPPPCRPNPLEPSAPPPASSPQPPTRSPSLPQRMAPPQPRPLPPVPGEAVAASLGTGGEVFLRQPPSAFLHSSLAGAPSLTVEGMPTTQLGMLLQSLSPTPLASAAADFACAIATGICCWRAVLRRTLGEEAEPRATRGPKKKKTNDDGRGREVRDAKKTRRMMRAPPPTKGSTLNSAGRAMLSSSSSRKTKYERV